MSKLNRRGLLLGATGAVAAGLAGPRRAWAQGSEWPTRPIRFIVPLAPGGAIDFIARATGERMSLTIGQQVLVENRTGAGGTIGMDAAMKSAPDGYTVLITNDNAASAPHIMKLSYDYTKELIPVCFLGRHGQILAAHSSIGVSTLKEFLASVLNAMPHAAVQELRIERKDGAAVKHQVFLKLALVYSPRADYAQAVRPTARRTPASAPEASGTKGMP